MPISFVGAGTVATGTNPTVDVPAGYAAGDALLIFTSGTATPTTPSGWVNIYAQGTLRFLSVILKIATASESSVTLTQAGTSSKAVMLAYRGTSYFDVIGTVATGTSTSPATSSLTTRFANDYVVSFYATQLNATPSTWTAPGSTTSRVNSGNSASVTGMLIVDELQAAAGASATRTATLSASTAWSAIGISFKEPQTFFVDPDSGSDANTGLSFAAALKNISGATSAKGVQPGDTVRVKASNFVNTGINAKWSSVLDQSLNVTANIGTISAATNATPIVCTLNGHGLVANDYVFISGGTGNTAVNGVWKISSATTNTFTLQDSSGNGTYGANSASTCYKMTNRVLEFSSSVVQPLVGVANFRTASGGTRAAWVGANANITTSLTNSTSNKVTPWLDTITIALAATTGKMAYYTLPATLDLSAYQQISFLINQTVGTTIGGLTFALCSDTTGDTIVNSFAVTSTAALGIWASVKWNNAAALGSSIRSIALYRNTVTGVAQTFLITSVVAVKSTASTDSIANGELLTKSSIDHLPVAVALFINADGSAIVIDELVRSTLNVNTANYYCGTSETVALYKVVPFDGFSANPTATTTATTINAPQVNGGASNLRVTYSGGWNRTDMSTQTGETWFSSFTTSNVTSCNGNGYPFITSTALSYTTFEKFGGARANAGIVAAGGIVDQTYNYLKATAANGGISIDGSSTTSIINGSYCVSGYASTNAFLFSPGGLINTTNNFSNCTIWSASTSGVSFNSGTGQYLTLSDWNIYGIRATAITYSLGPGDNTGPGIVFNNLNVYYSGALLSTNGFINFNDVNFYLRAGGSSSNIIASGRGTYGSSTVTKYAYPTIRNLTISQPSTGTGTITTLFTGGTYTIYNLNCSTSATTGFSKLGEMSDVNLYAATFSATNLVTFTSSTASNVTASNVGVYSQDENATVGNNKIYYNGGLITSQTAVRKTPSGYAWSLSPTSTVRNSTYPLELKIASVAANAGSAVTISAWMRRTNTGLTMQLVCPGGQPYGPSTDTIASMTAAADTWEQLSINFTPTQNAVFDIYAYAYGGTTFTGYVDDLSVSQ